MQGTMRSIRFLCALFHDFEGVDRPEEPVRVDNSGSGGDKRRVVSGGVSMYLCLFTDHGGAGTRAARPARLARRIVSVVP